MVKKAVNESQLNSRKVCAPNKKNSVNKLTAHLTLIVSVLLLSIFFSVFCYCVRKYCSLCKFLWIFTK